MTPAPKPLNRRRRDDAIEEARGHLKAALAQAIPADDKIIVEHMRKACDFLDKHAASVEARRGEETGLGYRAWSLPAVASGGKTLLRGPRRAL